LVADAREGAVAEGVRGHSYYDAQNGNCIPIPDE
jgi:hypothetical protein